MTNFKVGDNWVFCAVAQPRPPAGNDECSAEGRAAQCRHHS